MDTHLTGAHIRKLKALAQHLDAMVKIGKDGLSDALLNTLSEAFRHHELIKVKFVGLKHEKKALAPLLAERTSSQLVTLIGNVAVLYREAAEPEKRRLAL